MQAETVLILVLPAIPVLRARETLRLGTLTVIFRLVSRDPQTGAL